MKALEKTKLVKDFFLSSLEDKIGLTLRPSLGFFSDYQLENEHLGLFQDGYKEIVTLNPNTYPLLEYNPSSFIRSNDAFQKSYGLGAKGVIYFMENLFENTNTAVDFCGIAPLSSEFFHINWSKEYAGRSLPDLLIYDLNHPAKQKKVCMAEVKYVRKKTNPKLDKLTGFKYKIKKDLWNKYYKAFKKTKHPCFLSIVFNDEDYYSKGVIGSVLIDKKVDEDNIIKRPDLIPQDTLFAFLKDYLE